MYCRVVTCLRCIYYFSVDDSSKAEINGIQVGYQIMDVNALPYDNISHAHAVETLKDHTHLIITLRVRI
jgi:C-terminal processing protease CtpA/Prc